MTTPVKINARSLMHDLSLFFRCGKIVFEGWMRLLKGNNQIIFISANFLDSLLQFRILGKNMSHYCVTKSCETSRRDIAICNEVMALISTVQNTAFS